MFNQDLWSLSCLYKKDEKNVWEHVKYDAHYILGCVIGGEGLIIMVDLGQCIGGVTEDVKLRNIMQSFVLLAIVGTHAHALLLASTVALEQI